MRESLMFVLLLVVTVLLVGRYVLDWRRSVVPAARRVETWVISNGPDKGTEIGAREITTRRFIDEMSFGVNGYIAVTRGNSSDVVMEFDKLTVDGAMGTRWTAYSDSQTGRQLVVVFSTYDKEYRSVCLQSRIFLEADAEPQSRVQVSR